MSSAGNTLTVQESHKGMEPSGNMVMALDTLARSGE